MLRGRFNYPDLDVLDSPVLSPSPFGSGSLSSIPGSAIAERIFNDPDSWEETDGDEGDFPEDVDQLAWLAEEIEKFRAGVEPNKLRFDDSDDSPSTPTDKAAHLITTPTSSQGSLARRDTWKSIGKKTGMRPISLAALFENSNEDFSTEIQQQLSKILDSGGIPHHIRPIPHSSALSPPSTSSTNGTLNTPLHLQTSSIAPNNAGEISPSPVNIYSASATLSFLEWYGIFPDSPRLDINGRRMQPKSARLKTPLLQVPSPRHAARPISLLSPTSGTDETLTRNTKRSSSVPPPGLDPPSFTSFSESRPPTPPDLPRSPSPMREEDKPAGRTESAPEPAASLPNSSERGRPLRMTAPPPYARAQSPALPVSRSHSTSTAPSREGTPSRQGRRLPSIPPENMSRPSTPSKPPTVDSQPQSRSQSQTRSQSQPQPQPQPQPHAPKRVASNPMQPTPSRFATVPATHSTTSAQQGQQQVPRPNSVRSPLGGPAGPRIRSRASNDMTTRALGNTANRPPGLRL
ncbi:hypothetical protein JR316_0012462 [Psilocybe cubensis]|uniref:Uncharacterized protein n=2 Tax=Psilocybe cubensis TaxID=181762 RepID=A0A8H7XQW0_PSICU|nr:hypothetical protein JR316_0012462 [Psilocybe cubensis]KAH9475351.1 hypothetical protein JR316_0012462 [Psilocybe cubensis]